MTRGGRAASVLASVMLCWTCSQARPELVGPEALHDIVRRHYDQVCRDADEPAGTVLISEVFDTVGLGDELVARGLRLQPQVGEEASLDFVSRYGTDGRVQATGMWNFAVDSASAIGAAAVLRSRARDLSGLLAPTGFRSRLTLGPWPHLEMAAPIECQPHMVHRGNERPTGLPDSVQTYAGRAYIRAGNDSTVEVDISIDARGQVTAVGKRRGDQAAFLAVEQVIAQLQFDPAVRNGEAIDGNMVQTFRFIRDVHLPPVVRDSLFLSRRGFNLRASSFEALVHEGPIRAPPARRLLGFIEGRPGVRVVRDEGPATVYVGDLACPVQVLVNGGLPQSGGVTLSGLSGFLDMGEEMTGSLLTGLELYGPESGVVADSLGCGSLLIWSRSLAGVLDEPFVGSVDGLFVGMEGEYALTEVRAEPGGVTTYVAPSGRFSLRGLHPGRYELTIERGGDTLATGEVTVTAHATVEVELRAPAGR